MSINYLPHFRSDLAISQSQKEGDSTKSYLVQEPISGATFEFGEQQFFLCRSLNGNYNREEILARFENTFGFPISQEELNNFLNQLLELGLLDLSNQNGKSNFNYDDIDDEDDNYETAKLSSNKVRWSFIKKPEPLFREVALTFKPLGLLIKLLPWALIPLVTICCWLWLKQQILIQENLSLTKSLISFLLSICIFLITINLFTKLVKGVVASSYGATVQDFGIQLRWGFVPRFYIKISGIKKLSSRQQLRLHSSPLILRLLLFVVGTSIWYWNLGEGNSLSGWGIFFAEMGLITFLHGALPLRLGSPGAKVLCVSFRKPASYPRQLFKRSLQQFSSLFNRRPGQSTFISKEEFGILLIGLGLTSLLCFIVIKISLRFALGLSKSLPNIFGGGTFYIILLLLFLLALNYLKNRFSNRAGAKMTINQASPSKARMTSNSLKQPIRSLNSWDQKFSKYSLILLFALGLILFFPVPYSPGGPIQLLTPQQQQIQASVSGKVVEVFFNGGDGKLIQAGAIIARIVSGEIQNELLTIQEQIREQQANIDKQQANLNKQITGSRSEEIDVAKAQVEVAQQELEAAKAQVEVAQQELEAAKAQVEVAQEEVEEAQAQIEASIVRAKYSKSEVLRLETLYSEGAFSLHRIEEARKQAEIDRITIEERRQNWEAKQKKVKQMRQNFEAKGKSVEQVRQNLAVKRKNLQEIQAKLQLILSGSPQQDIEIARQEVEAARAELRQLKQELKYAQDKERSTELVMPFDGYLVDSYLHTKVGSYLNQGDTFAVAQYTKKLLGELELPEYDAGEITLGVQSELKLLAYPNQPILGKVVSIEPATEEVEESYGRIVKVLIDLKDSELVLKPGMSGYGKINLGKKPIAVLLTRPLIRFIQVELWSWLP